MKKTSLKKLLSVLLCLAVVVAVALIATGCASKQENSKPAVTADASVKDKENTAEAVTEVGKGEKKITFIAKDADGKETTFAVSTDAKTVGDALVENGLIAGDQSEYGLYVKTVNGVTLNYDTDKMYWAFYINGEYANTGVDATELKDGATYSFVATKG